MLANQVTDARRTNEARSVKVEYLAYDEGSLRQAK